MSVQETRQDRTKEKRKTNSEEFVVVIVKLFDRSESCLPRRFGRLSKEMSAEFERCDVDLGLLDVGLAIKERLRVKLAKELGERNRLNRQEQGKRGRTYDLREVGESHEQRFHERDRDRSTRHSRGRFGLFPVSLIYETGRKVEMISLELLERGKYASAEGESRTQLPPSGRVRLKRRKNSQPLSQLTSKQALPAPSSISPSPPCPPTPALHPALPRLVPSFLRSASPPPTTFSPIDITP